MVARTQAELEATRQRAELAEGQIALVARSSEEQRQAVLRDLARERSQRELDRQEWDDDKVCRERHAGGMQSLTRAKPRYEHNAMTAHCWRCSQPDTRPIGVEAVE